MRALTREGFGPMEPNFKADEFSRLGPRDRVIWCRRMAEEAARLAGAAASPAVRAAYVELSKQWTALADEIERDTARTV